MRRRTRDNIARCAAVAMLVTPVIARADPASPDKPKDDGTEIGFFPLVGGDTDVGFGAGAIGNIASYSPQHPLYRWKLDFAGFYATHGNPLDPSYIDTYAQLTIPDLLGDHLRVIIRPSYTRENALPFYGLGNHPTIPATTDPTRDEYYRLHPALMGLTRWRIAGPLFALVGAQVTYDKVSADPSSTLVKQIGPTDPNLLRAYGIARFEVGFLLDTRDNEVSPTSGMYDQVKLRASPQIGNDFPYAYQQLDVQASDFVTLIPKRLVLATRLVFDLETGDPPIYELSRYEETSAIGGGQAIRGVPAYTFYGRVKVFGNIELRARAKQFTAMHRKLLLGVVGFFDAGRLWTDLNHAEPALDGSGLGLHYGVGAGLRLQQGRSFVVRADLAWSPDAQPIGAYLTADEAF